MFMDSNPEGGGVFIYRRIFNQRSTLISRRIFTFNRSTRSKIRL